MTDARSRLIVFAREPRPGEVKTRLIPALGEVGAAKVYERLLRRAVAAASPFGSMRKELWCDKGEGEPAVCRRLAAQYGFALYDQPEGDLGTRMYRALSAQPPAPGRPALLMGSDCPGFSAPYLAEAFSALARHDAVIGPALDGGYVLIGLERVDRHLFEGIEWSTDTVLEHTRRRLRDLGWRWRELQPLRDLDRPSDLGFFSDSGIVSGS